MKFLKMEYSQTHGSIQQKLNDINIDELLDIQNNQLFNQKLKGGHMKDQ